MIILSLNVFVPSEDWLVSGYHRIGFTGHGAVTAHPNTVFTEENAVTTKDDIVSSCHGIVASANSIVTFPNSNVPNEQDAVVIGHESVRK